MDKVFFTSDTHFGSERALSLSRRPFDNVEEMDKAIIENWNKIVGKNDTVYHLGDFGDFKNIKKLNGKIILILGNYEKVEMTGTFEEFRKKLISLGFSEVYMEGAYFELAGEKIYLTHKPSSCKKDLFNLFGHIHEKNFIKRNGLNVGVDCFKFRPASLEDILFYKNAIENYYDEEVFCENLGKKDKKEL